MIIDCLRVLSVSPQSYRAVANKLHISSLKLLELVSQINKIEELIYSQSGDKLYLIRKIDWLDVAQIQDKIKQIPILDYTIQVLDEIGSTNDYILKNLDKLKNKTVITTEYQSLGKARNGKIWVTRFATDITTSFVYQFALDFKYELLPLIVAVAVNRLFRQFGVNNKIKWPNDVLMVVNSNCNLEGGNDTDGRKWYTTKEGKQYNKIAGILVESCVRDGIRYVIIGIGVDNIGNFNRNVLFVDLIKHVANLIFEYEQFGFDLICQEWLTNCIHYHSKIHLYQGGNLIAEGIHTGLSKDGALIIKTNDGLQKEYQGGNISLIPISLLNYTNLLHS